MSVRAKYLSVSRSAPEAAAICDRCNRLTNHYKLTEQQVYQGGALTGTNLLVCGKCLDTPNPQGRRLDVSPDPLPIKNPRPPRFA